MAEKLHSRPEQNGEHDAEIEARKQEALKETHEQAKNNRHDHADNLEEIRAATERHARPAEEIEDKTHPDAEAEQPALINKELKAMAYQRTLKRTRSRLSPPNRALSRIIHQPIIESASELSAKTVARPSGILFGGIAACIGSSIFLWISRHYGYEYNYLLFALLFIGGFFAGLIIELLYRTLKRR